MARLSTGRIAFNLETRYYTTTAGLLSEIGDPTTPGSGVTWVDGISGIPATAFWIAERSTQEGIESAWQRIPVNVKDGGIPFVRFTIANNQPALDSAQWITDAILAVEAFTGRDYSTQKEFGYGTTVVITYDDGLLAGTFKIVGGNDTWVAPGTFIDGSLVVDGTITADQIAANAIIAGKISISAVKAENLLTTGKDAVTTEVIPGVTELHYDAYDVGQLGTEMNGNVSTSDVTQVNVTNTFGFPTSGRIWFGEQQFDYDSLLSNTSFVSSQIQTVTSYSDGDDVTGFLDGIWRVDRGLYFTDPNISSVRGETFWDTGTTILMLSCVDRYGNDVSNTLHDIKVGDTGYWLNEAGTDRSEFTIVDQRGRRVVPGQGGSALRQGNMFTFEISTQSVTTGTTLTGASIIGFYKTPIRTTSLSYSKRITTSTTTQLYDANAFSDAFNGQWDMSVAPNTDDFTTAITLLTLDTTPVNKFSNRRLIYTDFTNGNISFGFNSDWKLFNNGSQINPGTTSQTSFAAGPTTLFFDTIAGHAESYYRAQQGGDYDTTDFMDSLEVGDVFTFSMNDKDFEIDDTVTLTITEAPTRVDNVSGVVQTEYSILNDLYRIRCNAVINNNGSEPLNRFLTADARFDFEREIPGPSPFYELETAENSDYSSFFGDVLKKGDRFRFSTDKNEADGYALGTITEEPKFINNGRQVELTVVTDFAIDLDNLDAHFQGVVFDFYTNEAVDTISNSIFTRNTTTIEGGKITTGTIEANSIAVDAITAGKISSGAITAGKIATDAITADNIQANAVVADKMNINGALSISGDTGSFLFKKTAFDDFVSDGVFIGNKTDSDVPTFIAGTASSYILADENGVSIINPSIFNTGDSLGGTLTSAGEPPAVAGGTFFYQPGTYALNIFSNFTEIVIQASGGGGGGGSPRASGNTGNAGDDGGDTIITFDPVSGSDTVITALGGDGGVGYLSSSHPTLPGESFDPLGGDDDFIGTGGPGSSSVGPGASATGVSAGGASGLDNSNGRERGGSGDAGSYTTQTLTAGAGDFSSTDTVTIVVGNGGQGGVNAAPDIDSTGGNGSGGLVKVTITTA